jgi:hypothetical protein
LRHHHDATDRALQRRTGASTTRAAARTLGDPPPRRGGGRDAARGFNRADTTFSPREKQMIIQFSFSTGENPLFSRVSRRKIE